VTLGAARAAIPVAPVAAALGLDARDDFARLRAIADVVRPAVVFARDGAAYAAAVRQRRLRPHSSASVRRRPGMRSFDTRAARSRAVVDDDVAVDGDTVAKLMFGSDPSGASAAVIVTHGMIGRCCKVSPSVAVSRSAIRR